MRKSSKTHKQQESDFALLRGGALPESVVRRHFKDVRKKQAEEIKKKFAIREEAAKYFGQIQPSAANEETGAISGLRRITERLAKQRLAEPRTMIVPPFGIWGTYTLRFTPPYSGLGSYSVGQISSVTGNPTISSSGVTPLDN